MLHRGGRSTESPNLPSTLSERTGFPAGLLEALTREWEAWAQTLFPATTGFTMKLEARFVAQSAHDVMASGAKLDEFAALLAQRYPGASAA